MNLGSILTAVNEKGKLITQKRAIRTMKERLFNKIHFVQKDLWYELVFHLMATRSLRFVKPGVKISADYHANNTLKPFLSLDVLRLLPNS